MDVMGISRENQNNIFSLLAGILHLGNVQFGDKNNYATVLSDGGKSMKVHDESIFDTFRRFTSALYLFRRDYRRPEEKINLTKIWNQRTSRQSRSWSNIYCWQSDFYSWRSGQSDLFKNIRLFDSSKFEEKRKQIWSEKKNRNF